MGLKRPLAAALGLALCVTAVPAVLMAGACGGDDAAKVQGWPRVGTPFNPQGAAGTGEVPPGPTAASSTAQDVPPRPKLTDIRAALAAPVGGEGPDASDAGPSDVGADTDVVVIRTWKGMNSCDLLIETACAYLGVHSEECGEIRGRQRPPQTAEVLTECQAIVDQFDMTYNRPGIRRVRNPCWSLSYDVCRDYGRKSTECAESKATAKRMRTPMLRHTCKGAIILYEARNIFPEQGPLRSPNSPPPAAVTPKSVSPQVGSDAAGASKKKKKKRKRRRKKKRSKKPRPGS